MPCMEAVGQLRLADMPASPGTTFVKVCNPLCLQDCVSRLIAGVHATVAVNPQLEEALRLIPRSVFLPAEAVSWHLLPLWSAGMSFRQTLGCVGSVSPASGHLHVLNQPLWA